MADKSPEPEFAGDSEESSDASVVLALTTWPADRAADALAHDLVSRRLAACVNILPAQRSIYRWNDAVDQADEHQLLIKTTLARLHDLEDAVRAAHPYDVPEWLVLPVSGGSEAYLGWVRASCSL
jgi:periplasmic divalent cation tolerance protein